MTSYGKVVAPFRLVHGLLERVDDDMTHSKDHKSPAEASSEGLELLENGRKKHQPTEETAASHPNGAKFDETPSEVHRGSPVDEKK